MELKTRRGVSGPILFALLFSTLAIPFVPVVSAIPPAQVWNKVLNSDGLYQQHGETASTEEGGDFVAAEWATGDVVYGTRDTGTVGTNDRVEVRRVDGDTGATVWTWTYSAAQTLRIGSLALDQRGRVYVGHTITTAGASQISVVSFSDGADLGTIPGSSFGSPSPGTVVVEADQLSNVESTDAVIHVSASDAANYVFDITGVATATARCSYAFAAVSFPIHVGWRTDGVHDFWRSGSGAGGTESVNAATCAKVSESATGEGFIVYNVDTAKVETSGPGVTWVRTAFANGVSIGTGVVTTIANPTGTKSEAKGFERMYAATPYYITCAQVTVADQVVRINDAWTTIDWTLEFTGQNIQSCTVDAEGAVYLLTLDAATSTELILYKYAAELGVPKFDLTIPQLLGNTELASVAVSNLVGFDVSPSGNSLITRYGAAGVSIQSHAGFTLATLGTEGTGCSTTDRVLASDRALVAYVSCDVGTGDADNLKTRTVTLGTPPYQNCDDCAADAATISFDEWSNPSDTQLAELGELLEFPLSFEEGQSSFGFDYNWGAYAWSANDGTIGVNGYSVVDPGLNEAFSEAVAFSGSGVDQLCAVSWSGNNFLGAVRSGVSTGIYRVTFEVNGPGVLEASITGPQTFPSARGISCAEDRIILQLDSQAEIRMYNLTTGAQVWAVTGLAMPVDRAVAFSDNGDWCSYVTTTAIVVCDALDGSTLDILTLPTGTHKGVKMSRAGQFLWYATSTTLSVWDVHAETTVDSVSDSPGGALTPPVTPPSADDPFTVPTIPGVSEFGGNLLFGVIMVVGMTVTMGASPAGFTAGRTRWSTVLAMIGAVLGFFMAWAFGYFNTAVVFGMIVLGGAGFYFFRRNRTEG